MQVQDDLRQLREKMSAGGGTINVNDLDRALAKTEEGLQVISSIAPRFDGREAKGNNII